MSLNEEREPIDVKARIFKPFDISQIKNENDTEQARAKAFSQKEGVTFEEILA